MKFKYRILSVAATVIFSCSPMQPAYRESNLLTSRAEINAKLGELESMVRAGQISATDFDYPVLISGVPREFSEIPGYVMMINLPDDVVLYCKFTSAVAVPSRELYSRFNNSQLNIKAIMLYN